MKEPNNLTIDTSVLVNYAYGLIAPDVAIKIKQALEADETLRWQYQGIIRIMKDYPDRDPEEVLEEMETAADVDAETLVMNIKKKRSKVISLWKSIAVAASVIIMAGIGYLVYQQNNQTQDPTRLAAEIVRKAPVLMAFRGNEPTTGEEDSLARWHSDYKSEHYANVVQALKNRNNLNQEEQFFLGVSYLKIPKPNVEKAEELFTSASKDNGLYTMNAWLYLGITQIMQKKYEAASISLRQIPKNSQAVELLNLLEK